MKFLQVVNDIVKDLNISSNKEEEEEGSSEDDDGGGGSSGELIGCSTRGTSFH